MSDDPKKPNEKQNLLGDLFSQSASEPDPNELPDDLAFDSADDSVLEQSSETATPAAATASEKAAADKAAVGDSNVIPINGRPPATAQAKPVMNPELTDEIRNNAAILRRRASGGPIITGKDADLVQYNMASQRVEPKSAEAAEMLNRLGTDADIYVSNHGSLSAKPMVFDREKFSLKQNPDKAVRKLSANPELSRDLTILGQTTSDDRMKRMAGLDPESEKAKEDKQAGDRRVEEAMKAKEEERKQAQDQPAMTPGAMLMNQAGQGLAKVFSAIMSFLRWAGQKIMQAAAAVTSMVQGAYDRHRAGMPPNLTNEIPGATDMQSMADAERQAPSIGESGAAGAAEQLRNKTQRAKQNWANQGAQIVHNYQSGLQNGVKNVAEGVGALEVGAPVINSTDAFKEQLATRSPQDKAKVTKGINSIRDHNEKLAAQVSEFAAHPNAELLATSDRVQVLEGVMNQLATAPKYDVLTQSALDNAVDVKNGGEQVKGNLSSALASAQETVAGTLERERERMQIEDMARTPEPQETEDYRPGIA